MGGKASAPAAPDYTPIATADETIASDQLQLGQEQMAQSQSNFNQEWPYAQQYLQQQTASSAAATAEAGQQQQYYNQTYQPIETEFANQAQNYDSAANANANAGAAGADVASSFDAARTAATQNLESYGIDPSQTRYSALDLGTRISQAAATAGAETQSRLNTQATGLGLEGEAINIGRGYPSAVAQSYATATGAGQAGLSASTNVANSQTAGASAAGSIMGGAANSNSAAASALNMGYSNSLAGAQFNANQSAQESAGAGQLIGGGLGLASSMGFL